MMSLLYESNVVIVTIKPGINHRKTLSSRSLAGMYSVLTNYYKTSRQR